MDVLPVMIGVSILLGLGGLFTFLFGLRSGQFDDPDGMRFRILLDDDEEDRYQEHLKELEKTEELEKNQNTKK
ncbi:MAG: cbb3-type cytochrome oxidase maturation protein [bacterium]|jgi:cbb3-type cytochrome oxidase maturation protein